MLWTNLDFSEFVFVRGGGGGGGGAILLFISISVFLPKFVFIKQTNLENFDKEEISFHATNQNNIIVEGNFFSVSNVTFLV